MGFFEKGKEYAPAVARYGVGIVFFLFGISQITNPENWIMWLPSFSYSLGISAMKLIYINGAFDLIIGTMLLMGLYTRVTAFIGSIHLAGIIFSIGYSEVAIRDFGLLLVLISIFLRGSDRLCIENKFK